jgi:hypothetical protein
MSTLADFRLIIGIWNAESATPAVIQYSRVTPASNKNQKEQHIRPIEDKEFN